MLLSSLADDLNQHCNKGLNLQMNVPSEVVTFDKGSDLPNLIVETVVESTWENCAPYNHPRSMLKAVSNTSIVNNNKSLRLTAVNLN